MSVHSVSTRRLLGTGVLVFGSSAVVSLLLAPWFRWTSSSPELEGGTGYALVFGSPEFTAWQALSGADFVIALAFAMTALIAFAAFARYDLRLMKTAIAPAVVGLGFVVFKMIDRPSFGDNSPIQTELRWGAWISLALSVVVVASALLLSRRPSSVDLG